MIKLLYASYVASLILIFMAASYSIKMNDLNLKLEKENKDLKDSITIIHQLHLIQRLNGR